MCLGLGWVGGLINIERARLTAVARRELLYNSQHMLINIERARLTAVARRELIYIYNMS
jgi:hypothetical protein